MRKKIWKSDRERIIKKWMTVKTKTQIRCKGNGKGGRDEHGKWNKHALQVEFHFLSNFFDELQRLK